MKLVKQQNGIVCKQDVVELIHVTPSQAYAILRKLVAEGKLSSSGTGRYAYYQINKAYGRSAKYTELAQESAESTEANAEESKRK